MIQSECDRHFKRLEPDEAHPYYTPACAHRGDWFVAVMAHRGGMWFIDLVHDVGRDCEVENLAAGEEGIHDWRDHWNAAVARLREAAQP